MSASGSTPARMAAALLLGAMASPCIAATPGWSLHADLEQVLREEGIVGAVWAVAATDGGTTIGAAGLKDARNGEPMPADARIHVGSVTKVVLAIGVLRLVSEGRLSLDAPVTSLLPSIRIDNPWRDNDPVRVRHLLAHTAGLENLRLWQFFSLAPNADTPLTAAFPHDAGPLRVQTRPGSRFGYSNVGYALLGMVIESVTGERYERYLDRHLLPALSMRDSSFGFTTQAGAVPDRRLAMGHFEGGQAQPAVPLYLRPAAQFTTTASDMAAFARFLMGDGRIDGRPFVDPALMAGLSRPHETEAAKAGLPIGHGHALVGRDRHGATGACHPGNTAGFMAMLCVFPDHGKAFFVAANTDNETADYGRLDALLIRALALPAAKAGPAAGAAIDTRPWRGYYVRTPVAMPHLTPLEQLTGFVRLDMHDGQLRIRAFPSGTRRLSPAGGALFRAPDRTSPSHVLLTADDGTRILSDGLRSYAQVPASSILLPWLGLAAGALGLVCVVAVALARLVRGRLRPSDPLFAPLLAFAALLLPLPLFLRQSILQLGERTSASLLLACVTLLLPAGLLFGAGLGLRRWRAESASRPATVALLLSLQGAALLAAWGLLPVRL